MSTPSAPSSKPFSLSLSTKPPATPTIPSKRNRAAFAEDNDSDDEEITRGPQAVSGFGENGAVVATNGAKKFKKEPLVIPVQADADWKRRAGGKNLLPPEVQAAQREARNANGDDNAEIDGKEEQAQYGLVLKQKSEDEAQAMQVDDAEATDEQQIPQKPKTVDEQAYDRLVNGDETRSTLIIPSTSAPTGLPSRHDEPSFLTDLASRPSPSTIADYEAVPIEEFGAALLRGMGWTEGGGVGRARKSAVAPKAAERRPNLLGIGAKGVPEGLEELGAWGKGAKKGPRTREAYNPVVMRNARTGETMTEEERGERDRRRREEERGGNEEGRRLEKRERDYDRARDGSSRYIEDSRASSRRHRSKSKERSRRHRSRSRDRRDYSDEERYREKDRSRRYRDERDDDRHRHRSKRDYDEDDVRRKIRCREIDSKGSRDRDGYEPSRNGKYRGHEYEESRSSRRRDR